MGSLSGVYCVSPGKSVIRHGISTELLKSLLGGSLLTMLVYCLRSDRKHLQKSHELKRPGLLFVMELKVLTSEKSLRTPRG